LHVVPGIDDQDAVDGPLGEPWVAGGDQPRLDVVQSRPAEPLLHSSHQLRVDVERDHLAGPADGLTQVRLEIAGSRANVDDDHPRLQLSGSHDLRWFLPRRTLRIVQ